MTLRVVPEGLAGCQRAHWSNHGAASLRAGRFGAVDHRRDAAGRRSGVVAGRVRVQSPWRPACGGCRPGCRELVAPASGSRFGASYAARDAAAAASYHGVWG